jgi:hypothetical protein
MTQTTQVVSRWLTHPRWPLVVCAAAVIHTLPAVPTGFVADDYVHRAILLRLPEFQVHPLDLFAVIGVSDGADAVRRVSMPWWAAPDLKLAFWLPARGAGPRAGLRAVARLAFPHAPAQHRMVRGACRRRVTAVPRRVRVPADGRDRSVHLCRKPHARGAGVLPGQSQCPDRGVLHGGLGAAAPRVARARFVARGRGGAVGASGGPAGQRGGHRRCGVPVRVRALS